VNRSTRLTVGVLALSATAFVLVAGAVAIWGTVDRLDVRFVRWVHEHVPNALVETMRVVTYAGGAVALTVLAVAVALVLARRRRVAEALLVVVAYAGSQGLDQALKFGFRRARPVFDDPFVQLSTYAFPSGHAFAASATYGALAIVLARRLPSRRTLVFGCAAALIVAVAASRVILGVHYLLDVVGGVLAGIAWLCVCLLVLARVGREGSRGLGQPESQRQRVDAHRDR
jgi:membrane-associated phospholipid phosphatase